MLRILSAGVLPAIFVLIIGYGLIKKVDVFEAFLQGAAGGLKTLVGIFPALVGLITAITLFRTSGAAQMLTALLSPLTRLIGIPSELMPLALLRPISGSGALAIVNDLLKGAGPDSLVGQMASVVMGSTETTFYTLAVYYGSIKIKNTRHTVPAALAADCAGLILGVWICYIFF